MHCAPEQDIDPGRIVRELDWVGRELDLGKDGNCVSDSQCCENSCQTAACDQIVQCFDGDDLDVEPLSSNGAEYVVRDVDLGENGNSDADGY
jgi:hypothetical protein